MVVGGEVRRMWREAESAVTVTGALLLAPYWNFRYCYSGESRGNGLLSIECCMGRGCLWSRYDRSSDKKWKRFCQVD